MATETKRVERARLYFRGKLIAEVSDVTYTHQTGDEQGHGTDGADYFSTGNDVCTMDFNTVTPKAGHSVDLKLAVLGHEEVEMSWFGDGGLETSRGRITERSSKSDSKTGMLTGSFKYQGNRPDVT